MGTFFSNAHIRKTGRFSEAAVIDVIGRIMAQKGFQPAPEERADGAVVVYAREDIPWISLYSDLMDLSDPVEAPADAAALSRTLDTDILRIACFDSDYLFLNLINVPDGTDAWAGVGSAAGLGIRRRSSFPSWKNKVHDLEAFRAGTKKRYVFAEDALEALASELDLPAAQGQASAGYLDELSDTGTLRRLYYALPDCRTEKAPPRLELSTYSLEPCRPEERGCVFAVNRGGAARGILVQFLGDYVEKDEITFSDAALSCLGENQQWVDVPLPLEKKRLPNGQWAYAAKAPSFPLPEKVGDQLPPRKKAEEEHKRSFGVRFTPHGNPRKFLDIQIRLAPLDNPQGDCCWCVWHRDGSKRAYIENANARWRDFMRDIPIQDESMLLDPEDYDLD